MVRPIDPVHVAERIGELRDRLGPDITLVAVTKGFGIDADRAAVAAGVVDLGENYAQELVAKAGELAAEPVHWHFIGRLQRNKVRRLEPLVWLWQSVDREVLVDELIRRAPSAAVLIQVNTTGEEAKGGCRPEDTERLVERARAGGLEVRGLMTVGPTDDPRAARPAFQLCRRLRDELGLAELSMGMSADLDIALDEGATMVRIGSAIFGPRDS